MYFASISRHILAFCSCCINVMKQEQKLRSSMDCKETSMITFVPRYKQKQQI